MKYNQLNQMAIKSLASGKHYDGRGLYLRKRRKDSGRWVWRFSSHGKYQEMGLGRWPDVSLADARTAAEDGRKQLREGVNPIAERRKEQSVARGMTLQGAIEGCFKARQGKLKDDGNAGRWMSALNNHVIPKIGNVPVEQVDQHALVTALKPIWQTKQTTAARALNRTRLSLKYAAALDLDVDIQAADKARALLGAQRVKVQHIPSMPYQEVPKFYRWLCQQTNMSAFALQLLILTATRTSEVRLATFDEFQNDVWILAPERTKSGREHRVPLSKEAKAVVKHMKLIATNENLFSQNGGKPMSDMAMSKFMRTNRHDFRPHGFRSSFRVWAEEKTDADYAVKEACLAHHVDSGVVGAYQRSDRLEKRRTLLRAWGRYVSKS